MMKTIFPSGRELLAISALASLVILGNVSAQAPNGDNGGGNVPIFWPGHGVSMQSEDIVQEGEGRHKIVVTYTNGIGLNRESLGDGDLLVVSRNGYLQEAALESVVELPIPVDPPIIVDPATGEPNIDPDNVIDPIIIFPPVWNSLVATYTVAPGHGERWTREDNGGYAVLLQRDEVLWENGAAIPPQLLGYFDVKLGIVPPEPILPVEAVVEIEALATPGIPGGNTLDAYFANARVWYEGEKVEVDWGRVVREGNTFVGTVTATADGDPDGGGIRPPNELQKFEHVFDLGVLGGGEYRFLLKSHGETVARAGFVVEVEPPGPIMPLEATVEIDSIPTPGVPGGETQAVHIANAHVWYAGFGLRVEWGDVKRDGDTFIGTVTAAGRDANGGGGIIGPPDVLQEFRHRFDLGALGRGEYKFLLQSHGETVARAAFVVDGPPPGPVLPEEVKIDIVELPTQGALPAFVAHVRAEYDRAVYVRWGELRRDGNVFYGHVETVSRSADDPVNEPGRRVWEHRYSLGMLAQGEYSFVLRSAGQAVSREAFRIGGVGVEPVIPDAAEIEVAPLPTIAIFPPPPTAWGADVVLRFENPLGVVVEDWGEVKREGRRLWVDIEAFRRPVAAGGNAAGDDGILPPRVAFRHGYLLGQLDPGEYSFTVLSRGERVGTQSFVVEGDVGPGLPNGRVELDVDASNPVTVNAAVWLEDAAWLIEEPGKVTHERNVFTIDATARRVRPVENEGDVTTFAYDLGELERGGYVVIYRINGKVFSRASFRVEGAVEPPVPIVHDIAISEGDASHFAEVSVVLPDPRLVVLDWGEVRRERNQFLVTIVVGRTDAAGGVGADGNEIPIIGVPGDVPVRLVSHSYVLGVLEPGGYVFGVTNQGRMIARESFVVRRGGEDMEPPTVEVGVENITEATERPQWFQVSYTDRSGLGDLDAIMSQFVTVSGPNGEALPAEMVEFSNSDDVPTSHATAVYEVHGPGGDWGVDDRGRYRIALSDPEGISDIHGNRLRRDIIGGFSVMIWPEPVEPPRKGEIVVTQGDDGAWVGTVHLRVPEAIAARDDWEVNWGDLHHRGNAFVAKVEFLRAGQNNGDENPDREPREGPDDGIAGGNPFEEELRRIPPDAPGQVISHSYRIGALRPGGYMFVAVSNIGHFLKEDFKVDGDGVDPNGEGGDPNVEGGDGAVAPADEVIALWRGAAFDDGQWLVEPGLTGDWGNADGGVLNNLLEYSAGTDPSNPNDDWKGVAQPEILEGADGKQHFGVRFRRIITALDLSYRIEGSRDMKNWIDVDANIEIVDQHASLDGIEEVLACLRENIDESDLKWLRVVVERN